MTAEHSRSTHVCVPALNFPLLRLLDQRFAHERRSTERRLTNPRSMKRRSRDGVSLNSVAVDDRQTNGKHTKRYSNPTRTYHEGEEAAVGLSFRPQEADLLKQKVAR